MKALCRLLCLALLVSAGLPVAAHADLDNDFRANVLDPVAPPSSAPTYYITGTSFQVIFTACVPNELPNGLTADGCFAGVNRSGQNWTGLDVIFQDNAALNGQPASCAPAPSDNIFATTDCGFNGVYSLGFSDGLIRNNDPFFITEDGVDPALFGVGDASVTTATPEPASLVLFGSGLMLIGFVAVRRSA